MHILITGAAGFLGRGLIVPFEQGGDRLRLMDVVAFDTRHEYIRKSVTDLSAVRRAMEGIDGLVIAHMAPRGDTTYDTPELPFDINVKGTANLLYAAAAQGVKRVVIISSTAAIEGHRKGGRLARFDHALPARPHGIYGCTKALQEQLGRQYADENDAAVACLRVGYILDGERNEDKYGRVITERNALDTDRRDIGGVARRWLHGEYAGFEVLHVMSAPGALQAWDVEYTCRRLDWTPAHDFTWLPLPKSD